MSMDQELPSSSHVENDRQKCTDSKICGEIEEIEDEVERRFNRFKNFDVIGHPPCDHHYLKCKRFNLKSIVWRSSFKPRIKQEWSLLEREIPNSIFVRAYEHRIDLMRAAIVGPPGSPCHHCLLFFDIYFPTSYPSSPPKFHYRSFGLDLNPNLRPHGKVCLSFMETRYQCFNPNWHRSNGEQKWNPEEYNILHVLRAIENTILSSNLDPPLQRCFSLHARSETAEKYNADRAFASACEMMVRVLRQPPTGFEDFVAGHFRKRAHPVLLKFKENKCDSEGVIDLFVSLLKAFERNGAYCKHHLDFLRSRRPSCLGNLNFDSFTLIQ